MRSSVDFWYRRISRRATVPGRYLCGFLTPPVAGADFRAALVASCFRGALPPVDLRAVCLVRAMMNLGCEMFAFKNLYIYRHFQIIMEFFSFFSILDCIFKPSID